MASHDAEWIVMSHYVSYVSFCLFSPGSCCDVRAEIFTSFSVNQCGNNHPAQLSCRKNHKGSKVNVKVAEQQAEVTQSLTERWNDICSWHFEEGKQKTSGKKAPSINDQFKSPPFGLIDDV